MRLWHPNDPYGVAVVRRVLLWFGAAVAVIGVLRMLGKGDPLPPFVLAAIVIAAVALSLEPLARLARGRPRDDR